ncbi:MAG TPA: hypothetical protein VFF06_30760 [Polyangia bacterium]|nr:hypothetical protein [Polyangia bacterium]
MKTRPSKHRPRRRRARPLLVAVAGTALLGSACSASGQLTVEPHDLAVQDQQVFGTPDLGRDQGVFGTFDLGLIVTDQGSPPDGGSSD